MAELVVLTVPPFTVETLVEFKLTVGDVSGWDVEQVFPPPPTAVTIAGVIDPSNRVKLGPWPANGEYKVTVHNNAKGPPSTTITIGPAVVVDVPPA